MKTGTVVFSMALALMLAVSVAAAAPKAAVAIETFSDEVLVDPLSSQAVTFDYPQVRHVSLTISALITGPFGTQNEVIVSVEYPQGGAAPVGRIEDCVPGALTVEFDASSWRIDAFQNSITGTLAVRYMYTVTYPAH